MARKSLESTLRVVTNLDSRRPGLQPPSHLPAAARSIFAEIVASVAPGHFRECDRPIIAALATSMHIAQTASEALQREGLTLGAKPNPHLSIFERATKAVANLSAKLRITPSSRLDRKIAGSTTRDRGLMTQLDEEAAVAALLEQEDDE
jgi:P27 family predicted phage terminase small subunit